MIRIRGIRFKKASGPPKKPLAQCVTKVVEPKRTRQPQPPEIKPYRGR